MPIPSGLSPSGIPFEYLSTVSETEFADASAALDRALLRAIGLPTSVDIKVFENAVFSISNKIKTLVSNFTLTTTLWIVPEIIDDGLELWYKMKPIVRDDVKRIDFISRTIIYAYKKHNPDLPFVVEPFETMIENLILSLIPALVTKADDGLQPLVESWIIKLQKFFV